MKVRHSVFTILIATSTLWAYDANDQLAELKANAEKHDAADRGRSYSGIAIYLTESAKSKFAAGESEIGQNTLKEMLSYARKAADSAKLKNKKIKETELNLRDVDQRLENLARTIAADDRESVKQILAEIRVIRKGLLEAMFGPKRK